MPLRTCTGNRWVGGSVGTWVGACVGGVIMRQTFRSWSRAAQSGMACYCTLQQGVVISEDALPAELEASSVCSACFSHKSMDAPHARVKWHLEDAFCCSPVAATH